MPKPLLYAIDWAKKENERPCSQYYHKLDVTKVAVSGQSCGGLMAIQAAIDPRITTAFPYNSGLFARDQTIYDALHAPMAIFDGGSGRHRLRKRARRLQRHRQRSRSCSPTRRVAAATPTSARSSTPTPASSAGPGSPGCAGTCSMIRARPARACSSVTAAACAAARMGLDVEDEADVKRGGGCDVCSCRTTVQFFFELLSLSVGSPGIRTSCTRRLHSWDGGERHVRSRRDAAL